MEKIRIFIRQYRTETFTDSLPYMSVSTLKVGYLYAK